MARSRTDTALLFTTRITRLFACGFVPEVPGEIGKDVQVTGDQVILGYHLDGIPELSEDLQASPGETQTVFNRLVGIGDAAERHRLGLPPGGNKLLAEQHGGLFLDENLGFEIKPGGKP